MNLVLYDTTLAGHHGSYLGAISKAATDRGWQTSIVLPRREEGHPQMEVLRQAVGRENVHLTER